MNRSSNSNKTPDTTEQIELAKTGRYRKWKAVVKKAKSRDSTSNKDVMHHPDAASHGKNNVTAHKNKAYHVKLSEHDEKYPCDLCGEDSSYYCNMNDQYFCTVHLVGHDKNEF